MRVITLRFLISFLLFIETSKTEPSSCASVYNSGNYDVCMDFVCKFTCTTASGKEVLVGDPENCDAYFSCQDNKLKPQLCPQGQFFSGRYKRCIDKNIDSTGNLHCQTSCEPDQQQYKQFILTTSFTSTILSTLATETTTTATPTTTSRTISTTKTATISSAIPATTTTTSSTIPVTTTTISSTISTQTTTKISTATITTSSTPTTTTNAATIPETTTITPITATTANRFSTTSPKISLTTARDAVPPTKGQQNTGASSGSAFPTTPVPSPLNEQTTRAVTREAQTNITVTKSLPMTSSAVLSLPRVTRNATEQFTATDSFSYSSVEQNLTSNVLSLSATNYTILANRLKLSTQSSAWVAEEGETVIFMCSLEPLPSRGEPMVDFTFSWFKDGQRLNQKSKCSENVCVIGKRDNSGKKLDLSEIVNMTSLNRGSSLVIYDVSEYHIGRYKCTANQNDGAEISSDEEYFDVSLLPVLKMTPPMVSIFIGESYNFQCELASHYEDFQISHTFCYEKSFTWNVDGQIYNGTKNASNQCISAFQYRPTSLKEYSVVCSFTDGSHSLSVASIVNVVDTQAKLCRETVDEYKLIWYETKASNTAVQFCEGNYDGHARKTCQLNGEGKAVWLETDLNDCIDKDFLNVLNGLKLVKEGWGMDEPSNLNMLSEKLSNLTSATFTKTSDMNATVESLSILGDIRLSNRELEILHTETKSVFTIISNTLDITNMESWIKLQEWKPEVAANMMKTVDVYMNFVDTNDGVLYQENLVVKTTKVLEAFSPDKTITISPPYVAPPAGRDEGATGENISLSMEFLRGNREIQIFSAKNPPETSPVYTAYYTNLENILPVENNSFLASKILGVKTSTNSSIQVIGGLNITFRHVKGNITSNLTRTCVFWDFDAAPNGNWSTNGGRVLWTNENLTTCSFDHMTNFALLMSVNQEILEENIIIRTISIVGCGISIVSLFLTIIMLSFSWKRVKTPHHYAILINLCIALMVADAIFIGGIDKTQPKELCLSVAVLLHFFYMASFFLMMAEGIQLVLYVVYVYHVQKYSETAAIIASAWIMALIVVGVSLGVTKTVGYGTSTHCWLSASDGLMWAFIGPALAVILINLIILFVVLWSASQVKAVSEKKKKMNRLKATLWNIVVVSPLLGVTWVFGVLSVSQSLIVFQYIFAVVNSLQGLFIFIFHGFCNQVRMSRKARTGMFAKKSSSSQEKQLQNLQKAFSVNNNNYSNRQQIECAFNNIYLGKDDSTCPRFDAPVGNHSSFREQKNSQSTDSSYVGSVTS